MEYIQWMDNWRTGQHPTTSGPTNGCSSWAQHWFQLLIIYHQLSLQSVTLELSFYDNDTTVFNPLGNWSFIYQHRRVTRNSQNKVNLWYLIGKSFLGWSSVIEMVLNFSWGICLWWTPHFFLIVLILWYWTRSLSQYEKLPFHVWRQIDFVDWIISSPH